jgi:L-lactate dehydrogenase complex protein LldG
MSSREEILTAIRRNAPAALPLPPVPTGILYEDPVSQFEKVFIAVGGRVVHVHEPSVLQREIGNLEIVANARQVASRVAGVASRGIDVASVPDAHALADLDVAVLPAEFGVAENGAVWIPGSTLGPHRAIFVIAQHIVLVLDARQIVSNMHQAYERVHVEHPGFGLFLSGPSKTADIEQSLVIGAHGARSCTLFLVNA